MATYVETKILTALLDHLATLALSPAMPVSWPNVNFTPPSSGGYLRATHAPNTANQITLGDLGRNRFKGLFQVDVFWPEGQGDVVPNERAGAIAAYFKRGTVLSNDGINVRIVSPPTVNQSLQSPPFSQIPVMIRYQADAANPS